MKQTKAPISVEAPVGAGDRTAEAIRTANPVSGFWLRIPRRDFVTCHSCRIECKRSGKHRNGLRRFKSRQCGKTFTEAHERPLAEIRLPMAKTGMDFTFSLTKFWG